MDYKTIFGIVASITGFIQYSIYVKNILAGKTRPHAFSWFVWGLPCGIVFAAQIVEGSGAGSWATGVTTAFCTFIFILSLFRGDPSITKSDWVCLIMALVALILWKITNNPLNAVILVTISDILGFGPTIRKSIMKPDQEPLGTYLLGSTKWILSLIAQRSFTLTAWLYPVAMIAGNIFFVILLVVRRRALSRPAQ